MYPCICDKRTKMEKKSFLEDSQFGSVSYFKVDLIECAIALMPIH